MMHRTEYWSKHSSHTRCLPGQSGTSIFFLLQ